MKRGLIRVELWWWWCDIGEALRATSQSHGDSQMRIDISIEGDGFYSIAGQSKRGKVWMNGNVEGSVGGVAHSDQTRMAADIAEGATRNGLFVTVHGFHYLAGGRRGQKVSR